MSKKGIYGYLDVDPEDGEQILYGFTTKRPSKHQLKTNEWYYNQELDMDDIRKMSDTHDYYPEIEPFLWVDWDEDGDKWLTNHGWSLIKCN